MATPRELLKLTTLDLSKLIVERGIGRWLSHTFEVSSHEFLSFAKEDFSENTKRGLLNALTNAKRAIDCQIDTILRSIGFAHDDSPQNVKDFVAWYESKEGAVDAPLKLKLIRALGMAPTGLIANARTLRNKLEPYYEAPDANDVKATVELAELFIGTTQNKLRSFVEEFTVGDGADMLNEHQQFNRCIYISYQNDEAKFKLCAFSPEQSQLEVEIDSADSSYLHLVKVCMTLDTDLDARSVLHGYLESIGLVVPLTSINVEVI